MELVEFSRKPFVVNAVQVTLENVADVAEWCKGTVGQSSYKMVGTETQLPCVKIPGQGNYKGQEFTALLGYWIVERKGSFRVYKPAQFESTFEQYKSLSKAIEEADMTAAALTSHFAENNVFPGSTEEHLENVVLGDDFAVDEWVRVKNNPGIHGFIEEIDGHQYRVRIGDFVESYRADELDAYRIP